MSTITPEQIAAQVAVILRHRPEARLMGIYTPGTWSGGDSIVVNGTRFPVVFCRSPLAISERLAVLSQAERLILLTSLPEQTLSLDVLARLTGRRLIHIDHWEMVREAFRASRIDPRIPRQGWLADALLGAMPEGGFVPVPNGWLDADTAWRTLFDHYLGLATGRPDASAVIQWSMDAERESRYLALAEPLRQGMCDRMAEAVGALGKIFALTIEDGKASYLLPIGLICEVLFREQGQRDPILSQGIARLEPWVGGQTLTIKQGQGWYEAARVVLDRMTEDQQRPWIQRAEQLLQALKAEQFAGLSTVLGSGFQQRLVAFGQALNGYLDGKTSHQGIKDAFDEILCHRESETSRERVERLEMALRLTRRLELTVPRTTTGIIGAMESYLKDGVFVDWARRYLLGGDPVEEVARAFGRLYRRIRDFREFQNRVFAERLQTWNQAPKSEKGFWLVEQFLDKIVAAVAAKAPMLVIVIDGMDGSIFAELAEDLRRQGWLRWDDPAGVGSRSLLSVLPTVTAFSRTALLTGQVTAGSSATEKSGFADHATLRSVSRSSRLPLLFHKGDLTEAAAHGLSPMVRQSIDNPEQRIVGVVLNAVDDHLAKSEQLRLQWSVNSFRLLDALLYEARVTGRAVVLTADHGHVLEEQGKRLAGGSEERWRAYGDPVSNQEMVFEGPRIKAATGMERVVLLYSEAIRYCQKKNGYHGGATPQEVIVPVGVFLSVGQELKGWQPLAEYVPEWWLAPVPAEAEGSQPMQQGGKRKPKGQASLFEIPEGKIETPTSVSVEQLIDSPVYAAQCRLAGRLAPPSKIIRKILASLEDRHGRVPIRMLAQAVQVSTFRLREMLTGLQRLLNVDGYPILVIEEKTETVSLDRELLNKQFQLNNRK